jgi:multiple sugar transport system permease protein
LFTFFIVLMFLPAGGTMMALYILLRSLHLLDSMLGLILTHIGGGGVSLFLMRQIFLNVPQEIEDAALVDGASHWRIAFQIMLMTFMGTWGSYLLPRTILRSVQNFTLPVGMWIVAEYGRGAAMARSLPVPGIESAVMVLLFFPTVIVFIALQKWFIRGAVEGLKL